MRFTSKLAQPMSIETFTRLVATVSKLSKESIIKLSPNPAQWAFIQDDEMSDKPHRLWCSLEPHGFFDDFRVEGVNLTDANEIFLKFKSDDLNRAVHNAAPQGASQIRIRLIRKESTPYLAVEILLPSSYDYGNRNLVHLVPVDIIPQRFWQDYKEPEPPNASASVYLPATKALQRVVAGMKNIDNYVSVSVNRSGCLTLSVETEAVTLRSHFTNLDIPPANDSQSSQDSDDYPLDRFFQARIPIKTFAHFLSTQANPVAQLTCSVVHRKMVHFHCGNEDVSFQYYIPSVLI